MKTLLLNLKINFSEKISTDDDILEVMNGIKSAIINQVNTTGLAPESTDGYTSSIVISELFSNTTIEHEFNC